VKFQELQVFYDSGVERKSVGTLAHSDRCVLFEYETDWQRLGIELAPLQMPISRRCFQFEPAGLPEGLPGLCADSLPDGWGALILDRFFALQGTAGPAKTALDRLALLGDRGPGVLSYQRDRQSYPKLETIPIGETATETYRVLEGDLKDVSPRLFEICCSVGGARPKALIGISECGEKFVSGGGSLPAGYSHWMVKFSTPYCCKQWKFEPLEGAYEAVYLQMAEMAGIRVPQHIMVGERHLAVRRFDRPQHDRRLHTATACGLLNADWRLPSLDYLDLLKLAWSITRDVREVHEQYRRAVFNLLALNCDDHPRNHGYLLDQSGRWRLAPAYDLTYSPGRNEEHRTSYLGVGRAPGKKTLLELAAKASISRKEALGMVSKVQDAVANFRKLCKQRGITEIWIKAIANAHKAARRAWQLS
jgi:serine/threonine-protein kinase HipA